MVFAGLCEYWKVPDDDQWLQSATIITTSDNPDVHESTIGCPSSWKEHVGTVGELGLADLDELQSLLVPAKKGTLLPGQHGRGQGQ
jgi:hypothetical protein